MNIFSILIIMFVAYTIFLIGFIHVGRAIFRLNRNVIHLL
jgi:hypothetical protein